MPTASGKPHATARMAKTSAACEDFFSFALKEAKASKRPDLSALLNLEHGSKQIGRRHGHLTAKTGVPVPVSGCVFLHRAAGRVAQRREGSA